MDSNEAVKFAELALVNRLRQEVATAEAKYGAAMAMLMAAHSLGPKDQLDLETGVISRYKEIPPENK